MLREKSVKKLLSNVEKKLMELKKSYEQSLEDKHISDDLEILVKNIMENLSSILDYIAHDIYETIITPNRKKGKDQRIYFPRGKNKKNFDSMKQNFLPNLEILSPDIYSLIESLSPHACGDRWLCDFYQILIENKHEDLSPQTSTSRKTYSVGPEGNPSVIEAPAGEIKAPPGEITINGIPISFDVMGIPKETPGLQIEVITWVSFVFKDTSIEVYPFLMKAFHQIREISKKIYAHLIFVDKSTEFSPSVRPELVEGSRD